MKKISFIKTLTIAALMFIVTPVLSSAEHKTSPNGSLFQAVVLLHERSPELNLRVERHTKRKAMVNVSSNETGVPINGVKIYSMTRGDEVFLLGETDSKGSLEFEDGYKHVMQLHPGGGYRTTEKFHVTGDIDLVVAMNGNESSVALFNKSKQFINSTKR